MTASDLIDLHDSLTEREAPIEVNRNIQLEVELIKQLISIGAHVLAMP